MKLTIDLSGRKGLAKKFFGETGSDNPIPTPNIRYLAANGSMVQGQFNPIRKDGFMSPNNNNFTPISSTDSVGSTITTAWQSTFFDTDAQVSYMGETFTPGATKPLAWVSSSYSSNMTTLSGSGSSITTAVEGFTDIEQYTLPGEDKSEFFAYWGGTVPGDIMKYLDSLVIDPTWLTATVPGGGNIVVGNWNDFFMVTADNGFMYILNANHVHKLDGSVAGGQLIQDVILFNQGITITDAIDWRGNLWIAMQSGYTSPFENGVWFNPMAVPSIIGVYVWDRISKVTTKASFIPVRNALAIRKLYITSTGELHIIAYSSQKTMQILKFNGIGFDVVSELPWQALPVYRDSVGQSGDLVIWMGSNGIIYAFGKPSYGENDGLYILGDTTSYAVGATGGSAIIVGGLKPNSTTVTYEGVRFGLVNYTTAVPYSANFNIHESGYNSTSGDAYTPVTPIPKLSTVSTIDIFCVPTTNTGTTETATISVYTNMSTTPFKVHSVTKDQTTRGYIRIPIDKPFVNSVQLKISWNTSVVIGDDTFLPMYAEVDYTPTKTAA